MKSFFKKLIAKIFLDIVSTGYNTGNQTLTIEYSNGYIEEYIGECAVWRNKKTFKRCGTMKEVELCDIYVKLMYENNTF